MPIFVGRGAPIHANARCGDFAVSVPAVVARLVVVRFATQLIGSLTHLTSPTTPRREWVRPVLPQARRAKVVDRALLALDDRCRERRTQSRHHRELGIRIIRRKVVRVCVITQPMIDRLIA